MIIHSIKMNHRQLIIPQSSVYQEQDHTIQEALSSQKRTLNPQLPISETIVSKEEKFACKASEPMFQRGLEKVQKPKFYLSAETPLVLQLDISKNVTKQIEGQRAGRNTQQEVQKPSLSISRLRQRAMNMKRNAQRIQKIFKEQPLKLNEEKRLERKLDDKSSIINKWKLIVPQVSQTKEIQQSKAVLIQEQNKMLSSKFSKSVVRSRLSETLNKLRYHQQQNNNNRSQRYTYVNSLDEKCQASQLNTMNSIQTNRNSQKMILQHIKNKAEENRAAKAVKKIVPGDSQSTQQHYSTIFGNSEPPKISDSEQQRSPKGHFRQKQKIKQRVTISYKTTLLQLKQICAKQDLYEQQVIILVPQVLSFVGFSEGSSQQEIFKAAKLLVTKLNISYKQLNIKKYYNCVIIVCENKAIVCYFSGKIYLGGWSCGQKMGLGLQLTPGKSVYYGQFRRNKREGVGIYKGIKGEVKGGWWKENHFQGNKVSSINNKLYKRSFFENEDQDD